jgi:NADP-dependent 3-hydroxy acid dehydrogenase YdfG
VFINSLAVRRPPAGLAAYTATKAALAALADVLRAEEGEAGVAVLSVFPGRTATAMQQELRRLEGQPYEPAGLLQPREVAAAVVAALALPPGAEITDLDLRPRRGRAR